MGRLPQLENGGDAHDVDREIRQQLETAKGLALRAQRGRNRFGASCGTCRVARQRVLSRWQPRWFYFPKVKMLRHTLETRRRSKGKCIRRRNLGNIALPEPLPGRKRGEGNVRRMFEHSDGREGAHMNLRTLWNDFILLVWRCTIGYVLFSLLLLCGVVCFAISRSSRPDAATNKLSLANRLSLAINL